MGRNRGSFVICRTCCRPSSGAGWYAGAIVGQTPRSARVPLDPLFRNEISFIQSQQADVGVGCGPGGPPHNAGANWAG